MTSVVAPRFGERGSIEPVLYRPLNGGRIVEWELDDLESVRAASVESAGGVSFLQADHLTATIAGRAAGAAHFGFLGVFGRFDVALDTAAMARALTAFVRRHEELRAHYPIDGPGLRRLVAPPEAVEIVTRVEDEPRHVEGDDLADLVLAKAARYARAEELPGWLFGATRDDAGFTLWYAADHVHGDGYSLVLAMSEIVELYRSETGARATVLPQAIDFGAYLRREQAAAMALRPDSPGVGVWRDALSANGGRTPTSPLDLGLDAAGPQPAVVVEYTVLDGDDIDRCDEVLAAAGASFTGALHAALAAAAVKVVDRTDYFVATVMATRDADSAHTQGWLCNFAPVWLTVDPAASTPELAQLASNALRRARIATATPVHGALGVLAAEGAFTGIDGSPQMVSYVDYRRLPVASEPAPEPAQLFTGVGTTRNSNVWFFRDHETVRMASQIPDNPTARRSMADYMVAARDWLQDLARGSHA